LIHVSLLRDKHCEILFNFLISSSSAAYSLQAADYMPLQKWFDLNLTNQVFPKSW